MKKFLTIALAFVMVFALCACGVNTHYSTTTTTTTTDADGNTHTETVTTTTENGKTSTTKEESDTPAEPVFEPFVDVPLTIINNTKMPLDGLYISHSDDESWGDNLLEGDVLDVGYETTGLTISFDEDHQLWDIKTVDEEGNCEFKGVNLGISSHDQIIVNLIEDDDGQFTAKVESAE